MSFAFLRHPLVITALVLTAVNDHFLKYHFANFWTGKISDFTGMFYFPLFLYALAVFIRRPKARHQQINPNALIICILLTDVLFVVFKFTDMRLVLINFFQNYLFPIHIVPDKTDLSALIMNTATYFFALKYFNPNALK